MRATRLLGLLVLLAAACTPTLPEEEKVPDVLRLREATVTLYPGHCAGVVVADGRHALTAAHCIDGPLGSSQPLVLRSGKAVGSEVVLVDTERDVAVLRLTEVAPVEPLPVASLPPHPGEGLLFAGRNDRAIPAQQVELKRLGRCPSLPHVPAALFTTLHGEKGDSGAPVVDARLQVVGLVHGGAACSIATPTAELAPLVDTLVAQAAHPNQDTGVGGSGFGSP
jgi:S1-C subfamily serine protease